MNINNYPEKLNKEEQHVLDYLICRMNRVLSALDKKAKQYVREAKDANIAVNPDLYLSRLLAERGISDTKEHRKNFLKARDELYNARLLLQYKCDFDQSQGTDEIKIGLHSCLYKGENYVISWKMPLCRHYLLDNASTEYDYIDRGRHGERYRTHYTLLAKNKVELRFTHVKSVTNMFPGIWDDKTIKGLKGKGFFRNAFLDEMSTLLNSDDFDAKSSANVVYDEFLRELLERRSTPEFKNIVFSIQKKQGEIIQAPYDKDMVVQGCAGSGKSMIMLHRIPILMFDNPQSLNSTNIYVITPSQMYIQLADNMRHQLELSDIEMGTIEQYYDHCINRYPGHKAGEYGKILHGSRLSADYESYIYSSKCIEDIVKYYEGLCQGEEFLLEKAYDVLNIESSDDGREEQTYAQKIGNRLLNVQKVLNANNEIIIRYFRRTRDLLNAFYSLSSALTSCKTGIIREVNKLIDKKEASISAAAIELKNLNSQKNAAAIQNRQDVISEAETRIEELKQEREAIEADNEYFTALSALNVKLEEVIAPFKDLKTEFSQNTVNNIYDVVAEAGRLIGGYYMLSWELSKIEDKYIGYYDAISNTVKEAGRCAAALQAITNKYLDFDYYCRIRAERDKLSDYEANAVKNAYALVMDKIGIKRAENGSLRAINCSPYVFLQALYQYQGTPLSGRESLLAIDEAQSIAPEEIRLLKQVNGGKVVFNMFGDVYQHIEGTKGVDSWNDFKGILNFDEYEIQENYRNASQITDFCNRKFNLRMVAINTPGKGVHEIKTDAEFQTDMSTQLLNSQRAGLAAILVSNDAEARYLMKQFSSYNEKLHNMTEDDFSIHQTRWNIIKIDDAKGLEFNTVIALSGRMSRNQRYIAYTRALDELYVYEEVLDVTESERSNPVTEENPKSKSEIGNGNSTLESTNNNESGSKRPETKLDDRTVRSHLESEVRKFFEARGLEVIDKRDEGGRLWVIGERTAIRNDINAAISKFGISGKYAMSKESNNKSGWCTKTDK